MSKLELKQQKFLTESELNIINIFSDKKVNVQITEKEVFTISEKIDLLKKNNSASNLLSKFTDVYCNVGPSQAKKYLTGFLEFNNLTFNNLLDLDDVNSRLAV